MVNKKTSKPIDEPPRKILSIDGADKTEFRRNLAKMATSPEFSTYRILQSVEQKTGIWEPMDIPILMEELRNQAATVNRGEMAQAEAMLMNQATALQSLFSRLTERALINETLPAFEANMKMALRAQSQCRATLETLSTIKNPPVIYARQANIANGPQQVNNGVAKPSQARDIENGQNKLSGDGNELLPHTRTSSIESRINPALETVGEVHRAKNGGRQGGGVQECVARRAAGDVAGSAGDVARTERGAE
ncbi:conserved hypothetical protein [Gammaproteobacteria bacterium]